MCGHQRLYFSFFYFVLNKHNRKRWKLLHGQRPHIQTGSSREGSNSLSAAMSLPGCKTGTPAHAALPEAKQATVLMGGEASHEARCSLSSSQVAPLAGGEATTLPGELFACSLPAADAAAAHPQGNGLGGHSCKRNGTAHPPGQLLTVQQQQSEIVAAVFAGILQHA